MNTERLYELFEKLTAESSRAAVVEKLEQLIQHITNQVNEPTNANHQTEFSKVLTQLRDAMGKSWFNQLTPLESDVLEKMDLDILVGQRLTNRISELMRENGMLPAVVRDELIKINGRLKKGLEDVKNTISNFQNLGLDEGTALEPGVGELALRIPRDFIGQSFSSFIEDAQFLKDLVTTNVELIEGKHDDLTLRSLASSDYGIFLEVGPQVVAFTVLAIERMMALYKSILEIRVLRDQLKERGVPAAGLEPIEANVQERIDEVARKGIEDALKEIKAKADKARANELKNHAVLLFTRLLEKLENNYDLDGRIGHADKPPEAEAEKAEHDKLVATDQQVRKAIKAIRRQIRDSKNLKALEYKPDEPPKLDDD